MNVIASTTPGISTKVEEPGRASISAQERARRKAAVAYARGSVRLEGFFVSALAEDLSRRYIDGEITRKEMTAALRTEYGL